MMKVGLALGSGSSRGWAHLGVIHALEEMSLSPQVICGTSIGATVGAAYSCQTLDVLEAWGRSLTRLELARYFELNFSFNGFINTDRFNAFLAQLIPTGSRIENLPVRFASVATTLQSGEEIIFDQGDLSEAVWASMSLPGVFPPFEVNGQWMVDGGLVNPVPVSVCRELGANKVIAVNLNSGIVGKHLRAPAKHREKLNTESRIQRWPMLANLMREPLKKWDEWNSKPASPGIMDTVANAVNIMQTQITEQRLATDKPDIIIAPELSHFGLMEFYRSEEAIRIGYEATMARRAEIEQLLTH